MDRFFVWLCLAALLMIAPFAAREPAQTAFFSLMFPQLMPWETPWETPVDAQARTPGEAVAL